MVAAAAAGVKVAFHIEPYAGRTAQSVADDVTFLLKHWGSHPALFRDASRDGQPLFFVYDSYQIPPQSWAQVFAAQKLSVKAGGSALMLGLWADSTHGAHLHQALFDGAYTYFAADGFSYGSTYMNWPSIQAWCTANSLLFVPSVGPGYDDTKVRSWNNENIHSRRGWKYYDHAWVSAIHAFGKKNDQLTSFVSITSFNEWHEGTQIEPAVPKAFYYPFTKKEESYVDYRDATNIHDVSQGSPDMYLVRTKQWASVLDIYNSKGDWQQAAPAAA